MSYLPNTQSQVKWLDYWERAIKEQFASDKEAMMSDGKPLHESPVDLVCNQFIVSVLLTDLDSIRARLKDVE